MEDLGKATSSKQKWAQVYTGSQLYSMAKTKTVLEHTRSHDYKKEKAKTDYTFK